MGFARRNRLTGVLRHFDEKNDLVNVTEAETGEKPFFLMTWSFYIWQKPHDVEWFSTHPFCCMSKTMYINGEEVIKSKLPEVYFYKQRTLEPTLRLLVTT